MPHHNGMQTGVRPKGQQLAAYQFLLRFVGHGQRCVAVLGGVAVAGEMLEGRQNAVLPQSVCFSISVIFRPKCSFMPGYFAISSIR